MEQLTFNVMQLFKRSINELSNAFEILSYEGSLNPRLNEVLRAQRHFGQSCAIIDLIDDELTTEQYEQWNSLKHKYNELKFEAINAIQGR